MFFMLRMQRAEATRRSLFAVVIDVVVLALCVVQQVGVYELWLDFGVGKNRKYFASYLLTQATGSRKSKYLPFFHGLTGCDTTSSVLCFGKRSAREAMQHRSALNNYALLRKSYLKLF